MQILQWTARLDWKQRHRVRPPVSPEDVTIRPASAADAPALARLCALDGRSPLCGPVLVAVAAGELVAALPLAGGAPAADPFVPTAGLVSLLELRAEQVRAACPEPTVAPGRVGAGRTAEA